MISEAVRCAKEVESDAVFKQADATDLPFEDGAFDSIVIRNSLWALDDPRRALVEMSRVLKMDGRLVIIDAPWVEKLSVRKPKFNDDGVRIRSGETGFGGTDLVDPIFKALPLTMEERPGWDHKELSALGMEPIEDISFDDPLIDRSIHEIVGNSYMSVYKKIEVE